MEKDQSAYTFVPNYALASLRKKSMTPTPSSAAALKSSSGQKKSVLTNNTGTMNGISRSYFKRGSSSYLPRTIISRKDAATKKATTPRPSTTAKI